MDNLCRICLCVPNLLIPIFDDAEISDKIRLISSVIIKENDGFPNGICVDCITKVDLFYNFRLVLINSDAELKRRATDNVIKIDEDALGEMIQWEQGDSGLKQSDNEGKIEVAKEIVTILEEPDKPQTLLCDICCKMIESRNFNRHLRKIHSKCKICKIALNNPDSLLRHKCEKHGCKICEVCGKLIGRNSSYRKHLRKFHKDVEKSSCSVCHEVFVNKINLEQHKKMGKCTTSCDVCKKEFKTANSLKQHKKMRECTTSCDVCKKEFKTVNSLKQHTKKHTKTATMCWNTRTMNCKRMRDILDKEHSTICKVCKEEFRTAKALKEHKRKHRHKCELCTVAFNKKYSLEKHLHKKHPGSGISTN